MVAAQEAHGLTVVAKQTMPEDTYAEMRAAMQDLVRRYDRGTNGAVVYEAAYLESLISKP